MHNLAKVIASIESSNNPRALRFEPAVFRDITSRALIDPIENEIMSLHECDHDTASVIYSTSFGLFQIMGFNIWGDLDYNKTFFDFVSDETAQYNMFEKFLTENQIAFDLSDLLNNKDNLDRFSTVYNGSVSYGVSIVETAKIMGLV